MKIAALDGNIQGDVLVSAPARTRNCGGDLARSRTEPRCRQPNLLFCLLRVLRSAEAFGPFKGGMWANPPHNEIPGLIGRLTGYSNDAKKEMLSIFKEVFKKRVDADYRPGVLIDNTVVKEVFRKARRFKELMDHDS